MCKMLGKITSVFLLSFGVLFSANVAGAADSPLTVDGATTVDTAKAKALFDDGVIFVDVRSDSDFEAGRIPEAEHLESKKVLSESSLQEVVAKDEPVVIYCNGHSCMRSSKASGMAVSWGWTKVYYYRDGFPAWKSAGYPVE